MAKLDYNILRKLIAKCQWTFARTMPYAPHEYIVRDKCPLTKEEFTYFVEMQRCFGIREKWGKYNNPYIYIDNFKYWTMGAPIEETTIINRAKANPIDDLLNLYNEFQRIKEEVKEKYPYHLNIMMFPQSLEPSISKVLEGFFLYKDDEYRVFKSFVQMCFGDKLVSMIEKPIFESEETVIGQKRIDILAYEKGKYAIIFENKIWDAPEQPKQLSNYIKGVKSEKYGFSDEQIFIVYLPSTEEHGGATDNSWDKKQQELFKDRYKIVSFKEGIIKWLNSESIVSIKDKYFAASRFLFVDFLKRNFHLTEIDNMEQKEIEKHIRSKFEFTGDTLQDLEILNNTISKYSDCVNILERMRKEYCCEIVKIWSKNISRDFPHLKKHEDIRTVKKINTGIVLPFDNIEEAVYVNIEIIDKKVCYGATYMPETKKIRIKMQESEMIKPFYENLGYEKGVDWLFFKYTELDIENVYKNFKELVEFISSKWNK